MRVASFAILILVVAVPAFAPPPTTPPPLPFSFQFSLMLPGTPEEIFDAATGDISGWWDHTFSGKPKALVLEPKVGGHFLELFDDKGNGAQHAEVIYCERPKAIRFEGPLGLSGQAIQLVNSYAFESVGDSTRFTLSVAAAGAISTGLDDQVQGAWRHFLIERFKPYIEAKKHKAKK